VFALHAFVVLADNGMSYQFDGASIINAVILAKILHVAEAFHFGEKFTGVRHVAGRCLCRRGRWRRPHSRQKSRREQARPRRRNARGALRRSLSSCALRWSRSSPSRKPDAPMAERDSMPRFSETAVAEGCEPKPAPVEDSRDAGSRAMLSYLKLPALLRACHPSDLFAFFGIRGELPSAVSA